MRIGILTFKPTNNYGGILQAFAMMQIIKELGHTPVFLNRVINYKQPLHKRLVSYVKRLIKKYLFKDKNIKRIINHPTVSEILYISKNTKEFIDCEIYPQSKNLYSTDDLVEISEQFDAIIVGSDQIWRKDYCFDAWYNYFLNFVSKKKIIKISYAASWGLDKWPYSRFETKKISTLLQDFTSISVREKSGVELCRKYLNVLAEHVLDPTMLLNIDTYKSLSNKGNKPVGNLLLYVIDPNENTDGIIKDLSLNYHPFSVFVKSKNIDDEIEERIYPSVYNWLSGFVNTEIVFTDSFHGCVFSILFNKPFVVYANKNRGRTRFESLLSIFGLENRIIDSYINVESLYNSSINWKNVNFILNEERERSIKFLLESLKNDL